MLLRLGVVAAVAGGLAACEGAGGSAEQALAVRAGPTAPTAAAVMAVAERSCIAGLSETAVIRSDSGRGLVTPRWSPDGTRLLLSGWGGSGLLVADGGDAARGGRGAGIRVAEIDAVARGGAIWAPGGESVVYPAGGDRFIERGIAAPGVRTIDRPAWLGTEVISADGGIGAVVVSDRGGARILYEQYRGRILRESDDEAPRGVATDAAAPRPAPARPAARSWSAWSWAGCLPAARRCAGCGGRRVGRREGGVA